ncbi:peptidoglycan-binding domain-containing protein [Streptomyces sp. NBC_01530]|uniref:peptidoglycan-binding domain-containing protein n=1 Tax=Streptomyces sp. NBC_01530 TaxID=2903895 RepID=UPI0038690137
MTTFHAAIVHADQTVTYCGEVDQAHADTVRALAAIEDLPRFVKEHPRQPGAFFVLRPDDEGGGLDWYEPTDAAPYTVHAPDPGPEALVAPRTATAGPAYIDGAERLGGQAIGGAMDHPESGPRFTWHVTVSPQGYFTSMASYLINAGFEPQVLYDPKTDRLGQFGPLTQSARALQNDGTRRTNREGKVNIQVEVVAMPTPPWTDGFDPATKPNFRKLLAAGRAHGIPDVWPAGSPVSSSSQAMSRNRSIWQSKAGHYGHCHVPGNAHWDPGGIDITKVPGKAATPKPPTPSPAPKPATKPKLSLAHVVYAAKRDPAAAQGHTSYKAEVLLVEKALKAEGLLAAQYVDGSFGSKTVDAYKAWQRHLGYSGPSADGIPGQTSLAKLAAKHGFQVVA